MFLLSDVDLHRFGCIYKGSSNCIPVLRLFELEALDDVLIFELNDTSVV